MELRNRRHRKRRDQVQLYMEYDDLHSRVRRYLSDMQGEVAHRAHVANKVNKMRN